MAILRGGTVLVHEDAIGLVDGVNKIFTASFPFVSGTLIVYLNGLEQRSPDDFVEIDNQTFEFTQAPVAGGSPDVVTIMFQRA